MYVPDEFAERDDGRIHAHLASNVFAVLVTTDLEGLPFASHLPLLHDPAAGANGIVLGHMARANPQWRHFDPGRMVLAVFPGPHAYISPSWYETHPAVPTWNYTTVHVYGRPRILEDAQDAKAVLARLVVRHESGMKAPWRMDLPADYENMMLGGIVAFEIAIERIEAKAKLSQNRDATDRANVAAALEAAGSEEARLAQLMRSREITSQERGS